VRKTDTSFHISLDNTPCPKKIIPNIIDCHSKKCLPILIIFSTNISGTTNHQMIGQFTTSLNVCFCTTWGKINQRNMRENEQKYVKKHSQHYRLWLEEKFINFDNFWCKRFWHSCPSNDCFSFPPHLMSASVLPGKTKASNVCIKININFYKCYIFGSVAPNSQSIKVSDCHAALCQPDDFHECSWI